jgi:hypothetical protein
MAHSLRAIDGSSDDERGFLRSRERQAAIKKKPEHSHESSVGRKGQVSTEATAVNTTKVMQTAARTSEPRAGERSI